MSKLTTKNRLFYLIKSINRYRLALPLQQCAGKPEEPGSGMVVVGKQAVAGGNWVDSGKVQL